MFAAFFYLLRQRGLHVSLNEWMTLLEGMEKGLHHSTLTGFYHLCRAIVVKNETEFDRFDQIFLEFFKNVPYTGELPEDLLDWLNHPSEDLKRTIADLRSAGFPDETLEELLKMLEERLKEQTEEHNGGNYWVGTQGRTPWGNSGWHPNGIRIGGQSMHRTAMMVAGERKFRDFRKDNKLDTRQFQMAFRTLRQLSAQERSAEKELDVDATIHDTCESAGRLEIRYRNPRKNTVKVLLLMDSGGSMDYYSGLCSQLFQAATKSNHFKELHTYYFHNCIYGDVYNGPRLWQDGQTPTEWLLQNFDASYKVILGRCRHEPLRAAGKAVRLAEPAVRPLRSGMAGAVQKTLPLSHLAEPGADAGLSGLLDGDASGVGQDVPHVRPFRRGLGSWHEAPDGEAVEETSPQHRGQTKQKEVEHGFFQAAGAAPRRHRRHRQRR